MNRVFKNIFMVFSCSAVLFLTACGSSNNGDHHSTDNGGDNGDDKPIVDDRDYISEQPYRIDTLKAAKSINVMTYNMQNVLGKTVAATALLIFPKTPQPTDGWRVVVLEHGSVGVANHCAPSMTSFNNNFSMLADELLTAGYVLVAPDYEGLGSAGIHPYLNLASEAKAAISAVKAIHHQYAQQLNGAWVSIGQSQGGQASLGTAEFANHDPQYKGAIAIAPISSFDQVLLEIAPAKLKELEKQEIAAHVALNQRRSVSTYATMLANTALIGVGIRAYNPQFAYQDLFQPRAKTLAERADGVNGLCLYHVDPERSLVMSFQKDMIAYLQANPSQSVIDYPGLDHEAFRTNTVVAKFLKDNEPGTQRLDKPITIIQDKYDLDVPLAITAQMVERLIYNLNSPYLSFIVVDAVEQEKKLQQIKFAVKDFLDRVMPAERRSDAF